MSGIRSSFEILMDINHQYEQKNDSIIEYLEDMDRQLMCVPVIGAFSSGKSAAINTLMGYGRPVLLEDITPQTAKPAEIHYRYHEKSKDRVYIYNSPDDYEDVRLHEYVNSKRENLDYGKVLKIRLSLESEIFSKFPHVMLVDMPGFGSDNDVHDKAINNYINNSMAYIIAFPAGDMIMRDDIRNILKELCQLEKPVCIMITKMDKFTSQEEFDSQMEYLKNSLKKHLGDREMDWLQTSSRDKEYKVDELKEYLIRLEEKAEQLLINHRHRPFLTREASKTLLYLNECLKKSGLSESELKERQAELNIEMSRLMEKADKRSQQFKREAAHCANEILNDVRSALNSELDSYVSMGMNGNEQQLSEAINSTVRLTVNDSYKKWFAEKAQEYENDISTEIETSNSIVIGGVQGEGGKSGFDTVGSGALGMFGGQMLTKLGLGAFAQVLLPTLAIPVIGIAIAAIGAIGGIIVSLISGKRKREEAREKLRQHLLSVVFPDVIAKLSPTVQKEIDSKTEEICAAVEKHIKERKESLEKALEDCIKKQSEDEQAKAGSNAEISKNIKIVEELCNAV